MAVPRFRKQGVVSVGLDGFEATSEWLGDGTFLVSVAGELDLYTVPELERAFRAADGAGSVVVDLSRCMFIDSTVLGVLLAVKRRLAAKARLSIVAASAEVRRPFELAGLDREFAFHPSLTSALNGGDGWHEKEARSQALFRAVNERIAELARDFGSNARGSFICECGNPECAQPIALTRAEYERVREHANRFAVALNHENPETETVVEENERFAVVESYAGEASQIARETDPRSQASTRMRRRQTAARASEGSS
jgi:anti-anti-sigma factor